MNTVMPLRLTIPVLTKEARVHSSAGVGKNLKLTGHFPVRCGQEVRRTLHSQQDQATNEPYCEMHAFYVV